ncbi:MAG: NAD(P)/FAD-dependent oxidoreductase [Oleiphilaceae bacterium]|nr:NAD(P)/FAD-dependent oxidoreductase [Oleiphilaceae bacterium]
MSAQTSPSRTAQGGVAATHTRVAIIGTGFSGLGMAIQLKKSGEQDFRIFEKEGGVGGTWRVNHYPGCACDVQSHLYSFSFEQNPEWTRMFAPQKEIRGYLEHCADKYRLRPHIHLNTGLARAEWDEPAQLWRLEDEHGKRYTANVLISGMGGLSIPSYPNIQGVERFQGKAFHSQDWDHDYDLRGKRVAVIGTGASAIQFVPEVQKQAGQLYLHQRSAPWIMPKPDRAITEGERTLFRRLPMAQNLQRKAIYWMLESRVLPMVVSPKVLKVAKMMAKRHIRNQISDPQLRRKVTPDYEFGCKRILLSNNYYPALDQPNVEVVTDDIREITETGIVTADGKHREVDAIIYGTGFKAGDPVPKGLVKGRNGQDLQELWQEGPEAYKGSAVAGFPNLFMLMGPNTGLGHNSMVYMIESQIQYALDAINTMKRENLTSVEVDEKAQMHYNRRLQGRLGGSIWNDGGCTSWYLHPETGKNVALWPGFTFLFRQQTRQFDRQAYALNRAKTTTKNSPQKERTA